MPVAYVCFLIWCLQTNAVGAQLSPPQNVTMMTLNTNYTLTWDSDQSATQSHDVTFTTQYVAKYKLRKKSPGWFTACENMPHKSCDLTPFKLHYLGIYVLRVQANANECHSDWVLTEFCPDKDAAVGPPSKVDLSPAGSDLDVFISDPLTSTNSSMKDNLPKLYYHIVYWERFGNTQALRSQTLCSHANMVTLPNLKAWTWYCVSIQSCYDFYNKSSSFTSPHCMQTEDLFAMGDPNRGVMSPTTAPRIKPLHHGTTPWWQIFVYFVSSLVICFLVMSLLLYGSFWCYKTFKATLYPSIQLPIDFKDYFCETPGSDIPRLLTPDSESELLCDKLTVCPVPLVLEIHKPSTEALPVPPSNLERDKSAKHSRQDSSSSRDSGVYSTGGSSSLQQPNSNQCTTEAESSWQSPFDLKQVKMQELAPGLKSQLLITDEGIVDMRV